MMARGERPTNGRDRCRTPLQARRQFLRLTGISLDDVRALLRQDAATFARNEFHLLLGRQGSLQTGKTIIWDLARHARAYRHLPRPHWEHEDFVEPVGELGPSPTPGIHVVRTLLGFLRDVEAACYRHPTGRQAEQHEEIGRRAWAVRALLQSFYGYPEPAASLRAAAEHLASILEHVISDPAPRQQLQPRRRGPRSGAFGDLCWWVARTLGRLPDNVRPGTDSMAFCELVALFLVGTEIVPAPRIGRGRQVVNIDQLTRRVKQALYRRIE